MSGQIGYYVHHHGRGHLDRARLIAGALQGRVTLIGTGISGTPFPELDLPDDRIDPSFAGEDGESHRPDALHYAPLRHRGITDRAAQMANWMAQARPSLMVVDVSVEVAMLARLCAVPVLYVRLGGKRDDVAHRDAFRGASALLAPFHELLDEDQIPAWIGAKTFYAPGLVNRAPRNSAATNLVLVILGKGGDGFSIDSIAQAAIATSKWQWRVIGIGEPYGSPTLPANLEIAGWVENVDQEIARAGVVVGAGGDGVVGQVLAAGVPFICIPEDRPFDEQRSKAHMLKLRGAAIALDRWPPGEVWPALLDRARKSDPSARHALDDPAGIAKAAAFIGRLADRARGRERAA
ncbi:MAG: glycosyltransferase [Sphingobium sp.]